MPTTRPHQNVPQTSINSHDLSHASSMLGEKNRRTATRDRTHKSSTLRMSQRPTVRCPHVMQHRVRGCTLQRSLKDWPTFAYRSSAHVSPHKCTSHSPTTEHHMRTLHHVYEACCCHHLTKSMYFVAVHHRPNIHQLALLQTCSLPPVGRHLFCSPNTLTLRSPEAVPPTVVSFAT